MQKKNRTFSLRRTLGRVSHILSITAIIFDSLDSLLIFHFTFSFLLSSCFCYRLLSNSSLFAEAYQCSLLGLFNIDIDAASNLLSYCLLAPKVRIYPFRITASSQSFAVKSSLFSIGIVQRKQKRNPRAEAHLATWTKSEAFLVGKLITLLKNYLNWLSRFNNSAMSFTNRIIFKWRLSWS